LKAKLGDLLTLKRGYDLPERARTPGNIPIVSSSGITGTHSEAMVKGPGVVTGRYGTLGEVFFVTEDFWPLNTSLYVKDFKGNDPRFIYYLLKHVLKHQRGSAAAVPGVDRNVLHEIEIDTPEAEDRPLVAKALCLFDDLISTNQRKIQVITEMSQTLFREWFFRFKYPGHEAIKLTNSNEIGFSKIPEGWTVKQLGTICSVNCISYKALQLPETVRYIDISAVSTGTIDNVSSIDRAAAPGRARRKLTSGDTIWSCVRPNRRSFAFISDPGLDWVASTGFAVLTPKNIGPSFLYHSTTTPEFTAHLVGRAQGAAYPAVRPEDFLSARVIVPATDVIEKFESATRPALDLANLLIEINSSLSSLRDLLLPKLLSGEIEAPSDIANIRKEDSASLSAISVGGERIRT